MHIKKSDAALVALLLGVSNAVFAQGGFAATASSSLNNITDVIVIIAASIAVIVLVWNLLECLMGRKTWPDFFSQGLWIVILGAGPGIAKYLFTVGKGMTF